MSAQQQQQQPVKKIDEISTPPTKEDLESLVPVKPSLLPKKYTRSMFAAVQHL